MHHHLWSNSEVRTCYKKLRGLWTSVITSLIFCITNGCWMWGHILTYRCMKTMHSLMKTTCNTSFKVKFEAVPCPDYWIYNQYQDVECPPRHSSITAFGTALLREKTFSANPENKSKRHNCLLPKVSHEFLHVFSNLWSVTKFKLCRSSLLTTYVLLKLFLNIQLFMAHKIFSYLNGGTRKKVWKPLK